MLSTGFVCLAFLLCTASFLCSALALCRLHWSQIKLLLRIDKVSRPPHPEHQIKPLNLTLSQHTPAMPARSSPQTGRGPPTPCSTLSPFFSELWRPLAHLALAEQIATALLGIVVFRWYSHLEYEDIGQFPPSPVADRVAAFCLTVSLCTRPIIIITVSTLACFQVITQHRAHLGRADWRLHAICIVLASGVALGTMLLSARQAAACLYLLVLLLTLCTCASAALALVLTVAWSLRDKAQVNDTKQEAQEGAITSQTSADIDHNTNATASHAADATHSTTSTPAVIRSQHSYASSVSSSLHRRNPPISRSLDTAQQISHSTELSDRRRASVCGDETCEQSRTPSRAPFSEAEQNYYALAHQDAFRTSHDTFGISAPSLPTDSPSDQGRDLTNNSNIMRPRLQAPRSSSVDATQHQSPLRDGDSQQHSQDCDGGVVSSPIAHGEQAVKRIAYVVCGLLCSTWCTMVSIRA